jgi:phosphatidylinositol glycan class B
LPARSSVTSGRDEYEVTSPHRTAGAPAADAIWLRWVLVTAFALMLASAWWCTGFIQGDEHFQILEFAGARLGLSRFSDLPWEYAARARSWLLPALVTVVRRAMIATGHDDPFFCAFLLRACSGVFYLAAMWRLARATRRWFGSQAHWRLAVALPLAFWFVPVVAARFSAESWSGSLFFLAFATLVRLHDRERCSVAEIFFAGFALGLAFIVRFQVALLDAGAIAWLVWGRSVPRREWGFLGTGAVAALVAGAAIDWWGYGVWSLPVWNYYMAQFPGGVLARYGAEPWWWYARAIMYAAGWPVGFALIAGLAGLCLRRPVHVLVWTLAPFIVFHLFVPTKELRYFFPMLAAMPYVIVLGLEGWWPRELFARHENIMRAAVALVAAIVVVPNAAAFAARLSIPLEPRIAVQETVYRSATHTVVVVGDHDPYVWWSYLRANWYRPADLRVVRVTNVAEASRVAASIPGALLVTRFPDRPDNTDTPCRIIHQSVPLRLSERWRARLDDFIPDRDHEPGWWFVARCDASTGGGV